MGYARTSQRGEQGALRDRMREFGLNRREIAAEFARRYRLRPRAAWRHAHGWTLVQAAAHINACAARDGLDPAGRAAMTGSHLCEHENWPGEGPEPSGRKPTPYLLALLAHVYGCAVADLLDLADYEHLPATDRLVIDKHSSAAGEPLAGLPATQMPPAEAAQRALPAPQSPPPSEITAVTPTAIIGPGAAVGNLVSPLGSNLPPLPVLAYRGTQMPDMGGPMVEREVRMAAHEGSEHAERAEPRDIGDATLDQLRADVARLSRDYMTGEPFPLFRQMRQVRGSVYAALDRRLWPRDATELYFLAGCINCLMAIAASGLGYPQAGDELVRAGWAYATAIDHRPLMARLRMESADKAYWNGRPRQARDLAQSGLRYLADGPNAALLHLTYSRAAARLGDADAAVGAITAASEAREREYHDDVLEIGGEFNLSLATQHYYAGSTRIEISGNETEAIRELKHATALYATGPEPGEDHSYYCELLAHADLATAQLRAGHLDAAADVLAAVLALAPAKRIDLLPQRLAAVRFELARPRYQGSAQARDLDERIEEFSRETIVAELHELPTGSG